VKLTGFQRGLRRFVKRFVYSQLYLREALFIVLGRARPFVQFKVEADPPSLYFNFALTPEAIASLEKKLDLPHPLAPIRCLEGEEPFHCLTLNVYRVSGLANGIRAEWSLYIREPSTGKTRYLIAEAAADSGSMDPISIVTRAGEATYVRTDDRLTLAVRSADGNTFRAECRIPDGAERVRADPEWVEANDLIYWLNGICDRTFYDAGLANAPSVQLDLSDVEIHDATGWRQLVDPEPRHVIVFEEAIEFAMSPWWNIDELGGG
jgi:hypothetical protein